MPTKHEMSQVPISKGIDFRNLYDSVVALDGIIYIVTQCEKDYIELKTPDNKERRILRIIQDNSNAYKK